MLDKLRAEALALIAGTPQCTLSTFGPAGVQASVVPCLVREGCIYVLVPSAEDHLFNLEHELEVVLTTTRWQLRGAAMALAGTAGQGVAPDDLSAMAGRVGATLVEVFPVRVHLEAGGKHQYRETIDFGVSAPTGTHTPGGGNCS